MSRLNGEKARSALQRRKRVNDRARVRKLRAEFLANPPKPRPKKASKPKKKKAAPETQVAAAQAAPPAAEKPKKQRAKPAQAAS